MSAAPEGPIKLTYFAIEGAAEKVRLAFTLGGIEFEDERVGREQWQAMKSKSKYGQMPMMTIGGGEPIAQSGGMLRYAGNLAGLNPPEKVLQIEEVIGLEEDMARAIMPSMYMNMKPEMFGHPADMPAEARKEVVTALRAKLVEPGGDIHRFLGYFESMLSDGRSYMCGDKPTIADCQLIPRLRILKKGVLDGVPANIVDEGYPKLTEYRERFHAIPSVQAYYQKAA
jgi:glutathione S-transferase